MSMKYVKAYYDWITVMEPLSDAERGRLMTAALIYASTGELIPLGGAEKYVFPTIRLQIDRDRDSYKDISAKRSAAGSLGGRPNEKQPQAKKANAFSGKQTKATQSIKSQDHDQDQDQEQDHAAVAANGGGLLTDAEMDALARQMSEVLDAAEQADFPQSIADFNMGNALVAQYGAGAVLSAIQITGGRPKEKRHWGYVKGVLEKDPTGSAMQAAGTAETSMPRFITCGGEP